MHNDYKFCLIKSSTDPLTSLLNIIQVTDPQIRLHLMKSWISDNCIRSTTQMTVLNPKSFYSEDIDFIKETMIKKMMDTLTTCTRFDISGNKITAELSLLKPEATKITKIEE